MAVFGEAREILKLLVDRDVNEKPIELKGFRSETILLFDNDAHDEALQFFLAVLVEVEKFILELLACELVYDLTIGFVIDTRKRNI